MDLTIITVTARCGHTTEQSANPGAAAMLREVAAQYPCKDCQSHANPFALQRKYGRGRGSSR